MNISVLIITYNESKNLPFCIRSLKWTNDIVVLDSFSKDSTNILASKLGARVYQRKFDHYADQRNYALENIEFKHDWILHLDADEIVTLELLKEMSEAIRKTEEEDNYDAFQIPSKTIFYNKWLKYSTLYPVYQVRLGHKNRLKFKRVGHGQHENISLSRVGVLKEPYIHYTFSKGISHWFEKHNKYSLDEAEEIILFKKKNKKIEWINIISKQKILRSRTIKKISYYFPFRPILKFIYIYFFRLGFLDGYQGLIYCRLMSIYEYMIMLKIKEIESKAKLTAYDKN